MRFGTQTSLVRPFIVVGFLAMSSAVHAATATWSISASIGQVDAELRPYFSVGDTVSGLMTIEEQPPCATTLTLLNYCRHFGAIQSFGLNAGSHGFSGTDPNSNGGIEITDSRPSTGDDIFRVRLTDPNSNNDNFGVFAFNNLSMTLRDSAGNAITSTALALTPPDSLLFDLTEFRISFVEYTPIDDNTMLLTSRYVIANDLHFAAVQPVPLPSTLILLVSGIGFLFMKIKPRRDFTG